MSTLYIWTYDNSNLKWLKILGHGSFLVVRVLAWYSKDQSSNPTEVCEFLLHQNCLKRMKVNEKDVGNGQWLKIFGVI